MLKPAPPFFVNGLLFLFVIIILISAFRNYSSIKDIFTTEPPPGRKYRIINWADKVLNDLVFLEMFVNKLIKKTKNETAWGY